MTRVDSADCRNTNVLNGKYESRLIQSSAGGQIVGPPGKLSRHFSLLLGREWGSHHYTYTAKMMDSGAEYFVLPLTLDPDQRTWPDCWEFLRPGVG